MRKCLCLFLVLICELGWLDVLAQDSSKAPDAPKARVFITDSQSWEIASAGGGSAAGFGGATRGGARPQTAEIIKTFGERCPDVIANNIQEKADYIVLLDHEGGKGALRHKNKVAVFARVSGDSIVSKSTLSLGGSVQDACEAIVKDWATHGAAMRETASAALAAATPKGSNPRPTAAPQLPADLPVHATAKLSVVSVPDGADIEVDGSFVGNTPSEIEVAAGDHTIAVKKAGFKNWDRNLKVSGGSNVHLNAQLEKQDSQPTPDAAPK